MYLVNSLSKAARQPNREKTLQRPKVEIHGKTIVASNNMFEDGMLEEIRKKSIYDKIYLQAIDEAGQKMEKLKKIFKKTVHSETKI